jgi:hypothetical protein
MASKILQNSPKRRFRLKPNPRNIGHLDPPIYHWRAIGETTEGRENLWVAFIAAKPEADRDIQRELMPAMRHATPR